ncbi:unnamed protein product [Cochlearia groenlandica]
MASSGNNISMQRVKVYHLSASEKWDERGTGHVCVEYMERSEELGLYVIDEEDNDTLLVHRISAEDIYKKQEETIISWRHSDHSTQLALSFQEIAGCTYVWNQICTIQRNLQFNSINSEDYHNFDSELNELPVVNVSTLPQILEIVTEDDIKDRKRVTDLILKDVDFFKNLMGLFDILEDSKDVDGLHMMFDTVKGIISLNSYQILVKILENNLIMKVIGCLEYDPNSSQSENSHHHRKYLEEKVIFKEAIPITDPLVLSKIHQTFRIAYLKDFVLKRVLDDPTAVNIDIESIMKSNIDTIVTWLEYGSTFFQELFAKLQSTSTSAESRSNLVCFLDELCRLSKTFLKEPQHYLLSQLVDKGIFDIITEVLRSSDKKLVSIGRDILLVFLGCDPELVRSHVVQPETPLLGLLVEGILDDFGDGQNLEIFDLLLDSKPLSDRSQPQRAEIMNIILEKHLAALVDFVSALCSERPGNTSEGASRSARRRHRTKPQVLLNICQFLCFCVNQDSSRTIFLSENMMEKILQLTRRKEKVVVAAAIRVCRALLSDLDENVQSYAVRSNLLKPIIDVFAANGERDNLVNSAILEFLEHIRKATETMLLKHIVDTYWDQLVPYEYLPSIQAFKTKYTECMEANSKSTSSAPFSPSCGRLVDYEDDKEDEEEERKPHPHKSQTPPCKENEQELSKRPKLCDGGGRGEASKSSDDDLSSTDMDLS